jgi:hypothetical protein
MIKTPPSYQQPVKEESRRLIWKGAIDRLTRDRAESRIISEQYVRNLWEYSLTKVLRPYTRTKTLNNGVLEEWCGFAASEYGTKSASDLRIAYLSGPEPENDLSILLSLGVQIPNVWAFEQEAKIYAEALKKAHDLHPSLKLYPGKIEEFIEAANIRFDVIYLDFTGPLFSPSTKPFRVLHRILESHGLSSLGVLIVNSAEPERNQETVELLADYFQNQAFVEGTVYGEKNKAGEDIYWYVEGPDSYGYEEKSLRRLVEDNFSAAYSAFATQYPAMYATYVQPAFTVLTNRVAKKRFFNPDQQVLESVLDRFSSPDALFANLRSSEGSEGQDGLGSAFSTGVKDRAEASEVALGSDFILSPYEYPLQHFLVRLKSRTENNYARSLLAPFEESTGGTSRQSALRSFDVLRSVLEGYWEVLSPELRDALRSVYAALPDRKGRLFCDTPMIHLWAEAALYQLGFPYHVNLRRHWRGTYKAKAHQMHLDSFVLDQCRAFYDWMPMIELYGRDLASVERQLISRICMDAISKCRDHLVPQLYFAANLICFGSERWATEAEISRRIDLNASPSK